MHPNLIESDAAVGEITHLGGRILDASLAAYVLSPGRRGSIR